MELICQHNSSLSQPLQFLNSHNKIYFRNRICESPALYKNLKILLFWTSECINKTKKTDLYPLTSLELVTKAGVLDSC